MWNISERLQSLWYVQLDTKQFSQKKKNDMYRKGSKDQIKWTEFMTIPPGLSKQSKKELANDTHSLGPSGNKLSQNTSSNYMHNLGSITM